MCGWNENNGYVSSPPRKYHYKELSGSLTFLWHQYDCSTWDFLRTYTYSGRVTPDGGWYEPAPCSFTPAESGWMEDSDHDGTGPVRQVYASYPEMRTTTITATTITYTGNGYCRCDGSTWCQKMSGTAAETLVEEDTEQMAEARALAAASAQDWTGPAPDSCKVASFRTDRGNTFSWSATQVQHRAQVPDYNPDNPDAEYEVDLWYVVTEGLMSARWVTEGFHTVTKKPTSPGDNWTEWVDIPIPEVGFFAWHMGCRVRVHNSGS